MIERYSRPEMANIWTEENKYRAWLEVEILADEAWAELGEIPKEDVALIREKADFDIDRILEIEQQTRHDVVAFTRAVSETLGEERKWVHYGLTSTDVVDTAYGYLYKQANDIIRKDLENFLNIIADKAKEHKFTIMMGRTHGVHAEPTTFGLKLATWYSEMKRNIERFEHAAAGVEAGKISGAVGNFANIPPFVEKYVCDKLGIHAQEIALVMSLALRFIPTLTDETRAIVDAQSARGGSIETGSLAQRIKAMSAIIVPIFAGTLRHADNLSLALDARCYEEGIRRTHWRALTIAARDLIFAAAVIIYIAAIIAL